MLKRSLSRRASVRAIEPIVEESRFQNIAINQPTQRTHDLITHDEIPERGSLPRQSSSSRSNSRVRPNGLEAPQMSRKVDAVRASQKLTRRASFGGNYMVWLVERKRERICYFLFFELTTWLQFTSGGSGLYDMTGMTKEKSPEEDFVAGHDYWVPDSKKVRRQN